MKKFILVFAVLLSAVNLVSCDASQTNPTTAVEADTEIVLALEGMTCEAGCKKAIEKVLQNTPGVAVGSVVYDEARAYVSFDADLVDENTIITAINESYQGAYKATKVVE
jgi:periplasmic mercuric ion binding protein